MADISKVQEILKDANFGEYVSLKCENNIININGHVVYLSEDKVDAVDINKWEKGWPKEEPTDLGPLCFTAEERDSTVKFYCIEDEDAPIADFYSTMNLQYSRDGQNWTVMDMTQSPADFTLANVGDKIYFKAVTENPYGFQYDAAPCCWKMGGKIAASGNIQYLLTSDGSRTDVPESCYNSMFSGCDALTTAPALPATTLASNCYNSMFQDCTSLIKAPALPAQTLATECYYNMFCNCTSLEIATTLPSTTLANWCYANMFDSCTSLTQAPELPATVLTDGCYSGMFQSCTSLTSATELPAQILADNCFSGMFYDCASLTKAPVLPVTTLATECYYNMFGGCTSLTTAPALPATTLADGCYGDMFDGCTEFSECHMKSEMQGVYNSDTHGDTTKKVVYDL